MDIGYQIRSLKYRLQLHYARFRVKRDGFWFVDIPRTSSSSIRPELLKQFGAAHGKDCGEAVAEKTRAIFEPHLTASEVRRRLRPDVWGRIFTFSFVRNPWDRTLSLFYMRRKKRDIPADWTFRDYLHRLANAAPDNEYFRYPPYRFGAADFLTDDSGKVIVDYVGRFENRNDDLAVVASRLGIRSIGTTRLPGASPTNQHYSQQYDEESEQLVRTLYRRDIELFGYDFEDAQE